MPTLEPLSTSKKTILVAEYKNFYPTQVVLQYGYFMKDGFGNFSLKAVSFSHLGPIELSFDWNHRYSLTDGLYGHYSGSPSWERGVIYLSSLRCSYKDFFQL